MTHLAEYRAASTLDRVAHVVGPVGEDHHAGSEVPERLLEREADDETGDPEPSHHRTDLEAEL